MRNLEIVSKHDSFIPNILLNIDTGVWEIQGRSYHENTAEFYHPILEWIDKALEKPNLKISLNFKMTYYNTSTARIFFEILLKLYDYKNEKNGHVVINWYYPESDPDIQENGEELADSIPELEFNLIEY